MKIEISITTELLENFSERVPANDALVGAHASFVGIVRGEENGRAIEAIEYEAYQPMAEREMEKILRELEKEFPCDHVSVIHRTGKIPVGEAAIRVSTFSKHRAEAFGLLTNFMDRLKEDVPIWKVDKIGPVTRS